MKILKGIFFFIDHQSSVVLTCVALVLLGFAFLASGQLILIFAIPGMFLGFILFRRAVKNSLKGRTGTKLPWWLK
jgi:hypothetical protein